MFRCLPARIQPESLLRHIKTVQPSYCGIALRPSTTPISSAMVFRLVALPRQLAKQAVRQCSVASEIAKYGAMKPHPQSIESVLSCKDVKQLAEFLKTEYPIRCAERIQMIEALPGWSSAPELQEVHRRHWNAFVAMRHFQSSDDLTLFTEVVDDIVNSNKDVVALMAKAMQWLSRERPEQFHAEFVDTFLDNFLLNRLGSNVLLSQYLAAVDKTRLVVGTIDPHCDVTEICRESAEEVQRICKYYTQLAPSISIETHDVTADDQSDLKFAFIPGIISYIVQEILKNSARATLHHLLSEVDVDRFPINIVVSGDHKRVMIHISDRAGGIPFDVGQHVWSYLYTTALNDVSCLAGFGVGLPISRLYANYLGGSMNLVSLPGYGTHAYVYFPRLNSEQVEVVPDKDHPWKRADNFIL